MGTDDGPIPDVNPTRQVGRGRPDRTARALGLKEWEASQLGDEDWFVFGAVDDVEVLGLVQVLAVQAAGTITRQATRRATPPGDPRRFGQGRRWVHRGCGRRGW